MVGLQSKKSVAEQPLDSDLAEHRIWALGHRASASNFNIGLQSLES